MERTYNYILLTGIGRNFPHYTKLIVFIRNSEREEFFFYDYVNSSSQHAEVVMLSNFESDGELSTDLFSITLTINYSPCSDCAAELISFYEENKYRIDNFTIRCSTLYRIKENRSGLKDLINADIDLEAMNEEYWEELANVTNEESQKYHQYKAKIEERDLKTRNHFQKLQQEIDKDKSTVEESTHEEFADEEELAAGFESLNLN